MSDDRVDVIRDRLRKGELPDGEFTHLMFHHARAMRCAACGAPVEGDTIAWTGITAAQETWTFHEECLALWDYLRDRVRCPWR